MDAPSSRERIVRERPLHERSIAPARRARLSAHPPAADHVQVRASRLDLVQRLASDLAHEIKNPLHSMVINLEVLRRRISRPGGSEPDELMRYANVLDSELERVNRRFERLLSIVRPDRSASPTTLRDVVDESLELLEVERERRKIHVVFEPVEAHVRPTLPPDTARHLVLDLLLAVMDSLVDGAEMILRTEIEPGWSHLRISAAGRADAEVDEGDLEIARAVTAELGGELRDAGDAVILSVPIP